MIMCLLSINLFNFGISFYIMQLSIYVSRQIRRVGIGWYWLKLLQFGNVGTGMEAGADRGKDEPASDISPNQIDTKYWSCLCLISVNLIMLTDIDLLPQGINK